jgi:hypothetical protein
MAKKKQKEEVKVVQFETPSQSEWGEINISQKRIEDCEWVFQFDDDEPQVFAWTDPELDKNEDPKVIFSISNIENSFISFKSTKTDKSFRIFAREIGDEGKELREKQKESIKNFKTDLENASENKEAEV